MHGLTKALEWLGRFRPQAAVGAVCWLLTGCYTYAPMHLESLRPPEHVRAHLTPEGAAQVSEVLGGSASVLSGELVEVEPGGVFLVVPSASVQSGLRSETLTQKLFIPRAEIVGVQRRRLDAARTGALVAAGAATAAFLLSRAFSGERGGTTVPPPGGGPNEGGMPAHFPPLP